MPHANRLSLLVVGLVLTCCAAPPEVSDDLPPSTPTEAAWVGLDARDRDVIQTALLALLSDDRFDMAGANDGGTSLVLDVHSPRGEGGMSPVQIRVDAWQRHEFPGDLIDALQRRHSESSTGEIRRACFATQSFDRRIVVTDLTPFVGVLGKPFRLSFGQARGWAMAWLPGYSADGQRAIVRAYVGPSAHGASLTALLERRSETWAVAWLGLAWYA